MVTRFKIKAQSNVGNQPMSCKHLRLEKRKRQNKGTRKYSEAVFFVRNAWLCSWKQKQEGFVHKIIPTGTLEWRWVPTGWKNFPLSCIRISSEEVQSLPSLRRLFRLSLLWSNELWKVTSHLIKTVVRYWAHPFVAGFSESRLLKSTVV